ncbi:MAG: hypothetical protein FWD35_00760 [Oscillospiraceae bacterium]|nr:hypothetical protein [Oscillospiraceae bacterium]
MKKLFLSPYVITFLVRTLVIILALYITERDGGFGGRFIIIMCALSAAVHGAVAYMGKERIVTIALAAWCGICACAASILFISSLPELSSGDFDGYWIWAGLSLLGVAVGFLFVLLERWKGFYMVCLFVASLVAWITVTELNFTIFIAASAGGGAVLIITRLLMHEWSQTAERGLIVLFADATPSPCSQMAAQFFNASRNVKGLKGQKANYRFVAQSAQVNFGCLSDSATRERKVYDSAYTIVTFTPEQAAKIVAAFGREKPVHTLDIGDPLAGHISAYHEGRGKIHRAVEKFIIELNS